MNSLKKSLVMACVASVMGLGVAFAQDTMPAAPPAAGGDMAAPAADAPAKPMKKMKMSKKHPSKKKAMKKM